MGIIESQIILGGRTLLAKLVVFGVLGFDRV
jgi:hypothetical protein